MNRSASSLRPSNPGVESPSMSASLVPWWNMSRCAGGNDHTALSSSEDFAARASRSGTVRLDSMVPICVSARLSVLPIRPGFAFGFPDFASDLSDFASGVRLPAPVSSAAPAASALMPPVFIPRLSAPASLPLAFLPSLPTSPPRCRVCRLPTTAFSPHYANPANSIASDNRAVGAHSRRLPGTKRPISDTIRTGLDYCAPTTRLY